MKYLKIHYLLCAIIVLVQTLFYCAIYVLYFTIRFLWNFKISSWYDLYGEPKYSTFYFRNVYARKDKNPIETYIRLYKLWINCGNYYE